MEVKVKVDGVEATVTVKDAAEAVSLLRSIASAAANGQSVPEQRSRGVRFTDDDLPSVPEPRADDRKVREALSHLAGSEAAKMLKVISEFPSGCHDTKLRERMQERYDWDDDTSLGPIMSNVSKACKRAGISTEEVLTRMKKRLGKGKIAYFYRVTEPAVSFIQANPQFDQTHQFPDMDELFAAQ